MGCQSKDVTSIFIDYADNDIGSVIKIDGKCYIKTGNEGRITHTLTETPVVSAACSDCEATGSGDSQ